MVKVEVSGLASISMLAKSRSKPDTKRRKQQSTATTSNPAIVADASTIFTQEQPAHLTADEVNVRDLLLLHIVQSICLKTLSMFYLHWHFTCCTETHPARTLLACRVHPRTQRSLLRVSLYLCWPSLAKTCFLCPPSAPLALSTHNDNRLPRHVWSST